MTADAVWRNRIDRESAESHERRFRSAFLKEDPSQDEASEYFNDGFTAGLSYARTWRRATRDPATWPDEGVTFRAWIREEHGREYGTPGAQYEEVGSRSGEWFNGRARMGVIVTHWIPALDPPSEE